MNADPEQLVKVRADLAPFGYCEKAIVLMQSCGQNAPTGMIG